ncbi:MAG: hypothetical protein ACRD22_08585 [Terriglobia bacterium]
MTEEKFETNLLRAIAAELHYANLRQTAVERYGKPLEKLGPLELQELQQGALGDITFLYRLLTPEFLSSGANTEGQLSRIPPSKVQ